MNDIGIKFNSNPSLHSVFADFKWTPDCKNVTKENYQLRFILKDNSDCNNKGFDTLYDNIRFIDFIPEPTLIDSSLITPNDERRNERLGINNIVENFCRYNFKKFNVFNRSGSSIYYSEAIDFTSEPKEVPEGVYFYLLTFEQKMIKGWIEIKR